MPVADKVLPLAAEVNVCDECPLEECDEASLWCAVRFATNPNKAQRGLMNRAVAAKPKRKTKRQRYLSGYYQANRDKKLAAANARYAAKTGRGGGSRS